jgi:hypothetical protein
MVIFLGGAGMKYASVSQMTAERHTIKSRPLSSPCRPEPHIGSPRETAWQNCGFDPAPAQAEAFVQRVAAKAKGRHKAGPEQFCRIDAERSASRPV